MDTLDVAFKYVTTTITRPAKTTVSQNVSLGNRIVVAVNVLFAPGHVGLTGVAVQYGGLQILPYGQVGSFIYGDSERLDFDIGMYMPGPVTIRTTNADSAAHTFQLTWKLQEINLPGALPIQAALPLVVA